MKEIKNLIIIQFKIIKLLNIKKKLLKMGKKELHEENDVCSSQIILKTLNGLEQYTNILYERYENILNKIKVGK